LTTVSIGNPTPVHGGKVVTEPVNLGGGRMLFLELELGLGTGLGSTLIVDATVAPLELGHLPYRKATFGDHVGERARKRRGKKWKASAFIEGFRLWDPEWPPRAGVV
jgi:hypothetical protein